MSAPLSKRAVRQLNKTCALVDRAESSVRPAQANAYEEPMSRFHDRIRPAFEAELHAARRAEELGEAEGAFRHLERAHVLGQASTRLHTRVHWLMLRWAIRHGDADEFAAQAFRIAAAAMKTVFGLLPHGNTGGANVGAFRPMRVPTELQRLIDAARR
jgi:hypothetical protein